MGTEGSTARSRRLLAAALCAAMGLALTVGDATAQWWPWGGGSRQDDPPVPREGMRSPRGQPPPEPFPPSGGPPPPRYPAPGQAPGMGGGYTPSGPSNICLQLEQRLVLETQGGGGGGREMLPRIETEIRDLERGVRSAELRLDRSDCWDTFLFSKTLRRDPRCRQLSDDVENQRRRLVDLDRQRRQIMGTGDRSLQDDIVRELARNGCGRQYEQEARKRDNSSNPFALLFGGGEESEAPRGPANQFGNLPFATYRTLCVRLCDGYYFPVSFSTLPNHFQRDAQLCQSQCAAPAELFYHQNPGGAVEQMVSVNGQPYTGLKSAFRYRKEFIQGCSCKQAEYDPGVLEKRAEAPPAAVPAPPPASGVRVGAKK